MMVLFVAVVGGLVVAASYFSKWDVQKRMRELRAREAALREKKSRFDAHDDHCTGQGDDLQK